MAGYTRQSSSQILSGEIVSASPLNAEFNQVLAALHQTTGHKHDGTTAEGPPIDRVADADQLNKVLVDTGNNQLEFYVQVSSASVEQLKIQDGAIVPVTDNDIDLGTASLEFKDLHLDGTANIDALVADTADINAGTIDGTAIGGTSASTGAFTTISATGVVSLSDGSAGAPALTNTGDTNNGLYFNAADELSYTSAGTAQVAFADGVIKPVTDNDVDLGTASLEFKDAYFDGTVTTDALVADTADINGGTADNVTIGGTTAAAGSFSTLSATGVVSVSDGSAGAPAITNTGDTNNGLYFNAADELTYTSAGTAQVTFKDGAIVPVSDNDIDLGTASLEFKDLYVDGTAYLDSVNIAGGSITGISTLADLGNAVPLAFSTTTTDSDPGGGNVRLNNATQNAATAFYIDDADSNAAAIATFVQSLSAGNAPSATLGFVTLRKQYAPEVFATYKVTAVVNATGYTKLTVANLAASATNPFSDADAVLLSIDLAGDKGDAGDMQGPATATDNAIARFNGTGGSTVQNSAVVIDDSNNITGVVGLAASGDITVADNKYVVFGTNSDIKVGYDESGGDALQIGANVEGAALKIHYYADEADDNADNWLHQVANGGVMTWGSKISGSYVTHLTVTPNSTVADSTIAAAGNLDVGGILGVFGSKETPSTKTTNKNWLDDTENLAIGGTLDNGWDQQNVSVASNQAASYNGATVLDKLTATGGTDWHYIRARRGSLDGSNGDIKTLSFEAKKGTTDRVELALRTDTTSDGYLVKFNLTSGTVVSSSASNQGVLVASGIFDLGGGNYRCYATVDMSDGTGNSWIAQLQLNDSSGNTSFAVSGTAETAFFGLVQVNDGGYADYVANTATTGQSYGFDIDADDRDTVRHTLATDTIINIDSKSIVAGDIRRYVLLLTQGSSHEVTLRRDHTSTSLTEIEKPSFASQSSSALTKVTIEAENGLARVWYEEIGVSSAHNLGALIALGVF